MEPTYNELKEENRRLRQDRVDPGLAVQVGFIEGFKQRQDLLYEEPDKDASAWWLLLPIWLLGSSVYAAYAILHALISLL